MHRLLFAALLVLLLSACAAGNDTPAPAPAPDFTAADNLISANLAAYNNNVYFMVGRNGQVLHSKGWGTFTATTKRGLASASKMLSGAVILALVDAGKLSLSDSVGKYLPIFTANGKGSITIRQLFSHTSGLPGGESDDTGVENADNLTLAQAVDSIARSVALVAVPGAEFNYGGKSMHVAGRIAEVVTGKSWAEVFATYIGGPCQMTTTAYDKPSPQNPLIAGGCQSSPAEYMNFLEMLAGNGVFRGTRVLSTAAINLLFQDQTNGATFTYTPYPSNLYAAGGAMTGIRYSVGAWLDGKYPDGSIREISSPGAFGTHPWVDRQTGTYGIIFVYRLNGSVATGTISQQVRQAVRQAIEATL